MKPNDVAIRKRSQIAKANRTMFVWIAVASVLVGFSVVVSIFLFQKLVFNEEVLFEKNKTVSTLEKNNAAIPDLKAAIRVLDTNSALASVKANEDDQAIQVILDALPSEANSLALGASLQNKLLANIPGLTVESLQVDSVVGIETLTGEDVVPLEEGAGNVITFQFSVSGDQNALKQVLTNMERSIRTIEIMMLRVESQGGQQVMSVQARAFYEPKKNIELQDKVMKKS